MSTVLKTFPCHCKDFILSSLCLLIDYRKGKAKLGNLIVIYHVYNFNTFELHIPNGFYSLPSILLSEKKIGLQVWMRLISVSETYLSYEIDYPVCWFVTQDIWPANYNYLDSNVQAFLVATGLCCHGFIHFLHVSNWISGEEMYGCQMNAVGQYITSARLLLSQRQE